MKRFIALACLLPMPLMAQEVGETSYDYFDVNYIGMTWPVPAAPDLDGNGFEGRFSVEIRDHLFFNGEYSAWDFDGLDGGSTSSGLGIGSNWDIGRFSVFGVAGYRSLDLDLGAGNMEEETVYLSGGLRWQVARGFELRASADYADLSPARTGETSVTVGGDIYLTDVISIAIELNENDDDVTTALVGLRFYPTKDSSRLRKRR